MKYSGGIHKLINFEISSKNLNFSHFKIKFADCVRYCQWERVMICKLTEVQFFVKKISEEFVCSVFSHQIVEQISCLALDYWITKKYKYFINMLFTHEKLNNWLAFNTEKKTNNLVFTRLALVLDEFHINSFTQNINRYFF